MWWGKAALVGFLGKAFDPYTLYPSGDDMDMEKMSRIKVDDLRLRPDVFPDRMRRRARLHKLINSQMPDDRQCGQRTQARRTLLACA